MGSGRVENEPCSDSYQIRDLEHDALDILNFLAILSLVILIKGILVKKKRCMSSPICSWHNLF